MTALLSNRERQGLRDLKRYEGQPYFWMPRTMEQLAERGFAERHEFTHWGKPVMGWRWTEAGRAALDGAER